MRYQDHPLYKLWCSVVARTRPGSHMQRKQPCYRGVSLHPLFETFPRFRDWADKQPGSKLWPAFQFDKDLLSPTVKQYGPDNCIFLPAEINKAIGVRQRNNESGYPGVSWCKQTESWQATIRIDGKKRHLGRHHTKEEAFDAYCQTKREEMRSKALKWRDHIDPRAYEALMQYDLKTISTDFV